MRLTILSIQKEDQDQENQAREKTLYHNEIVDAISDASLERAEYLQSLAHKEEKMGTFIDNDLEDDIKFIPPTDQEMEAEDDFPIDDRPVLDMDYEYMAYSKIKKLGKTKDVFKKDDPFPMTTYSKKLRKR